MADHYERLPHPSLRGLAFAFCGRVRRVAAQNKKAAFRLLLVGRDGFEPSKSLTADLQSAPFGHSGTYPYSSLNGAGGRTRTPDLLITNQLLYQLSYTSMSLNARILYHSFHFSSSLFFIFFMFFSASAKEDLIISDRCAMITVMNGFHSKSTKEGDLDDHDRRRNEFCQMAV